MNTIKFLPKQLKPLNSLFHNKALRALCAHLLFQLWTFSLCKTKTEKRFADFLKNRWISKFNKNQILLEANFGQNFVTIGSVILKFIGHKRTDKQTNKQSIYIYIDLTFYRDFKSWSRAYIYCIDSYTKFLK